MAKNGTLKQYFTQSAGLDNLIKSYNPDIALFSTVFEWSIKSQDVLSNTSVITWAFKIEAYDLSKWQTAKFNFGSATSLLVGVTNSSTYVDVQVNINGKTEYSSTTYSLSVGSNKTATLASGECSIAHNSDGSLTTSISTTARIKDFYNANGEASINDGQLNATCSFSGQIALDPIPRHAVIQSAPNFNDEENPTITFTIPSEATNVKAYISFSTSTIDIGPYPVSGSSYTFNFTEAEKKKLWSILEQGLDTKQVYFYVMSDHQGTTYYSSLTRTLTIVNYTPTLDPEVYDTVGDIVDRLTGNKYILVRYASKPYFSTGAQAHKGATIDAQSVKNGETTLHGASGTFDSVTDNLFKFAATDSFGRSVSADMEFSRPNYFIDYVKLTCSMEVTDLTADGDVGVTLKGKYFNGSFGKRNNSMRMHYDISKNGGEFEHVDKGYIYPTVSGSDYTYTFTIPDLDYLSVYELIVRVSDEVSVEGVPAETILASTPIFDWGRQDFNFNVPVTIQGGSVPTIVAQGTAGIWTYRTWSDGTAECWGKKDFTVNVTSQWGSMYTSGAISGSNVSFPFGLFAETPIVNASLLVRSAGGILMAPGGAGSNIANMDQTGVYEIARGTSLSNAAYTINYQVIGRWK